MNPSDEVIPKLHSEYGLERLDFVFMDHWKKCYAPDLQVGKKKRLSNSIKSVLVRRTTFKLKIKTMSGLIVNAGL